jgi:hypothetical protein
MMPLSAVRAAYTISPSPFLLAQDNSGKIINNACVWTYVAGTTTAATTYSTATGTANSNPIRSDSAGRFTAFLPRQQLQVRLRVGLHAARARDGAPTADNIAAMPPSGVNSTSPAPRGKPSSRAPSVYLSDGSGGTTPGSGTTPAPPTATRAATLSPSGWRCPPSAALPRARSGSLDA